MSDIFKNITYFDTLDSSSDYLIQLYKKHQANDNFVIVVDNQEKGRGRMAKKWFSNKESLTFSLSIKLNKSIGIWQISMLVSVALIRLLQQYEINALIKYPNDIIVHNKKIAGILTESIMVNKKKYCVVGVGLNVNNEFFPQDIANAISMKNLISQKSDKIILLKSLLKEIQVLTHITNMKKIYFDYLCGSKNYVRCFYKGNEQLVKILNITKHGLLTILTNKQVTMTINDFDIKFTLN